MVSIEYLCVRMRDVGSRAGSRNMKGSDCTKYEACSYMGFEEECFHNFYVYTVENLHA